MSDGPHILADQLVGRRLRDRYVLDRLIASGGMAHVWAATDVVLERQVAVKILHDHLAADESFVARFRAEAVSAARLNHPSIVAIYDTIGQGGVEAIVMELIRGETFREWLDRQSGPADIAEVKRVVIAVAQALATAHSMGVVHRDIKPSNILLCDDDRVMVADFGIAKLASSPDLTATGSLVGTARYLSPEQVRGEPTDGRTDVYSLAVVLYEAATGRSPFNGTSDLAIALARLQDDPPPPRRVRPELAPALEAVIQRGMALDPADRHPSADDFRLAVLGAEASTPTREITAPTPPSLLDDGPAPSFAESERTWLVPMLLLLLVAVALGVAGLLIGRTNTGQDLIDRARGAETEAPAPDPAATAPPSAEEPNDAAEPIADDGSPLQIVEVGTFDPEGDDGGERDDLIGNAIDGDPATTWRTSTYNSANFGNLKSGVGFYVRLDQSHIITSVALSSPSAGWSAKVYAADAVGRDLAGWGQPVGVAENIGGNATITTDEVDAEYLLVWITRLPENPRRVEIGEITITTVG